MFKQFMIDSKISREDYDKQMLELRTELIRTQYKFKEYNRPMLLVLTGVDGAGKGEMVNALADVMDSRLLEVATFWQETDEETERPYYWRFWNNMPMGGKLGIYFNGWYERTIRKYMSGDDDETIFLDKMKTAEKTRKDAGTRRNSYSQDMGSNRQKRNKRKGMKKLAKKV